MRQKEILRLVDGKVALLADGMRRDFPSGRAAAEAIEEMEELGGKYGVSSISAEGDAVMVVLKKDDIVLDDLQEAWAKEHMAAFGERPGFF